MTILSYNIITWMQVNQKPLVFIIPDKNYINLVQTKNKFFCKITGTSNCFYDTTMECLLKESGEIELGIEWNGYPYHTGIISFDISNLQQLKQQNTTTLSPESDSGGLSGIVIVFIILGVILFLGIIGFIWYKNSKEKPDRKSEKRQSRKSSGIERTIDDESFERNMERERIKKAKKQNHEAIKNELISNEKPSSKKKPSFTRAQTSSALSSNTEKRLHKPEILSNKRYETQKTKNRFGRIPVKRPEERPFKRALTSPEIKLPQL